MVNMGTHERRRKAFKVALAYAGATVTQFAAEQGVTPGHLYQVLRGDRDSRVLLEAVESYIAVHTPRRAA